LKFDVRAPETSEMAERIRALAAGRPILVAGSTVEADGTDEETLVIQAWEGEARGRFRALLVLAPRHPQRFGLVESIAMEFPYVKASDGWGPGRGSNGRGETVREVEAGLASSGSFGSGSRDEAARTSAQDDGSWGGMGKPGADLLLLDTLGDLAAVYGIADVALVGGSLVAKGGHNPLEPARFGVPVVMGPSFENFREIVVGMRAADGIRIVEDGDGLRDALIELLGDRAKAQALGERGRQVFEQQSGATVRTVAALIELIRERAA
jgi:3-deoxy-D-manno-octulosonic-acid transferase